MNLIVSERLFLKKDLLHTDLCNNGRGRPELFFQCLLFHRRHLCHCGETSSFDLMVVGRLFSLISTISYYDRSFACFPLWSHSALLVSGIWSFGMNIVRKSYPLDLFSFFWFPLPLFYTLLEHGLQQYRQLEDPWLMVSLLVTWLKVGLLGFLLECY